MAEAGHRDQNPDQQDLLVELGCEELPPKALDGLVAALFQSVCDGLEKAGLEFDRESSRSFATPRRMAIYVSQVAARQPDQVLERKGPAVQAAFDADGNPTKAAEGFARSVGRDVADLERTKTDQGEWLFCRVEQAGQSLAELLYPLLEQALGQLPIPKPMRWSDHTFSFVRPVHWLVVLHGDHILEGELLGNMAGRHTRGHRIHAPGDIELKSADVYESTLAQARVIACSEKRRARIQAQALAAGQDAGAGALTHIDDNLLAEVNNLVEWPEAILGSFDAAFLEVPAECLVASMQDHQKFFPVVNDAAEQPKQGLLPAFVAIANLESRDPSQVRQGFERVINPRLADARFFWEKDQKIPLADRVEGLDRIVFQKKLGTIGDKCRRMGAIVENLAKLTQADTALVGRAAKLCKADLVTDMVGEFPELQGVMGRYYALADGEDRAVAAAIEDHYRPRFAGDAIPDELPGQLLALADRLDSLVGIFAIGQAPTGNRDPFALRRAALGVVRIIQQAGLRLSLRRLVVIAADTLAAQKNGVQATPEVCQQVVAFVLDRLRNAYREGGTQTDHIRAVLASQDDDLTDVDHRITALVAFMQREEAQALAAANKRIGNILNKADGGDIGEDSDISPQMPVEKTLFDALTQAEAKVKPLCDEGAYDQALDQLAGLREPVDQFFDQVMVMDEDLALRKSRLALLRRIKQAFDRIASLSATE